MNVIEFQAEVFRRATLPSLQGTVQDMIDLELKQRNWVNP
jgi:hypothetical protein